MKSKKKSKEDFSFRDLSWIFLKAYLRHPEGIPWRVKRKNDSIEMKMKQEKEHEFPPVLVLSKWSLSLVTVSWCLTSMLSERQMSCQMRNDARDEEEGGLHGSIQFLQMIKFTLVFHPKDWNETRKWRFFDLKDRTHFILTWNTKLWRWWRKVSLEPRLAFTWNVSQVVMQWFPWWWIWEEDKENKKKKKKKNGDLETSKEVNVWCLLSFSWKHFVLCPTRRFENS